MTSNKEIAARLYQAKEEDFDAETLKLAKTYAAGLGDAERAELDRTKEGDSATTIRRFADEQRRHDETARRAARDGRPAPASDRFASYVDQAHGRRLRSYQHTRKDTKS